MNLFKKLFGSRKLKTTDSDFGEIESVSKNGKTIIWLAKSSVYNTEIEIYLKGGQSGIFKKHSGKSKRANQLLLAKYPMDFLSGDWKTILRKFLKLSAIGLGIYCFIAGLIETSNGTIVDGFLIWFGGFVIYAIINGIAAFIPEKIR